MKDNVTHMHGGRYTTCDAECPHFYLQMTKGTVVPGKQTVFGPAYLVFEDLPTPLALLFGFFPQKREQNAGFWSVCGGSFLYASKAKNQSVL